MNDGAPPRVRVTGPPRRARASGQPGRQGELREQTGLGEIYLQSLMREQLVLAARILTLLGISIGSLPLVFYLWPRLAHVPILGVPAAWVVLGVAVYPLLVLLGWLYVRQAERNERTLADLVRGNE